MARLTRQIGITAPQVRLPQSQSVGPAIVKTAATLADIEYQKMSDKRTQEAQVAAAKLVFERDDEGNLVAPSLPFSDNGLLAPSIFDRKYTQMVGQRYLQQTQIDTAKTLNEIAIEHRFDPTAFQEVAEGYVNKVTELAPDFLKPDVNNAAQVKMVEHYNHIIRQKAERDHSEARGVHLQFMDDLSDELIGYIESGADDEIVGAKMLEIRAAIEQGDELNYWLDDEKMMMHDTLNKRMSLAEIITQIQRVPLGDDVAQAEMIQSLSEFANGDGKIVVVNELGERERVDVTDIYPNPEDRAAIAEVAANTLNAKMANFENLQDARLQRNWEKFFNWYDQHAVTQAAAGQPLDMGRLSEEFSKAHNDVMTKGYDSTLREAIRNIMLGQYTSGGDGSMSKWKERFLEGWVNWHERYQIERENFLQGRNIEDLTPDEMSDLHEMVVDRIGSIPGGHVQSEAATDEVNEFYTALTGRTFDQSLYEDLIANPDDPRWAELKNWMPLMGEIGLWDRGMVNAMIGKLRDPETMSPETLKNVLALNRMFWEEPTFRYNMIDSNALGGRIGRALDYVHRTKMNPTPAELKKILDQFADSNWSPRKDWLARSPEERETFRNMANERLEKVFQAQWTSAWWPSGIQAPGLFTELAGIPEEVRSLVIDSVIAEAGFIDTNDPETFDTFIYRATHRALAQSGWTPSKIGYSPQRYGANYDGLFGGFDRPDYALSKYAPEYYARDKNGNVDRTMIRYVEEDAQVVLNAYEKQTGNKFVIGKNAALIYNGEASRRQSAKMNDGQWHPMYEIALIKDDGNYETLQEYQQLEGVPVYFNMMGSMVRYRKDERKMMELRNQRTAAFRTDYQNGQLKGGQRLTHGSIQ